MDDQALYTLFRETLVHFLFADDLALSAFGLDLTQYEALRWLRADRGLAIGELRERLLIDKSRATRLVDGLESQGLVRRVPDPYDRRSPKIVLTAKGSELRERAAAGFEARLGERFSTLTPAERAQLSALLERLNHQAQAEAVQASQE